MALAATMNGQVETVAAASTENHVVLDSQGYDLVHTGEDASGTPDVNTVYISDQAGITASAAAGSKFVLQAGWSITIPSDWRACYFKTAAGAPTLSILPKRGR